MQPVVKPAWQQCWTNSHCSLTGCQTGLYNRFDNRVEWTATVRSTVVKPGLTTVLNQQLFVQPVVKLGCTTVLTTGCIHDTAGCQTGCQTGWTTGWMFVYTIQPVIKPVWQQVLSCKWGLYNHTMDVCSYYSLFVQSASTVIIIIIYLVHIILFIF